MTPKAAKLRALLTLLLLRANEPVARDVLIECLWDGSPPATAPNTLQHYVSELRKLLPAETVVTQAAGYELRVAPGQLDLARFEQLATGGREALAAGETARGATLLAEALELWRGPPLADFSYESWAQQEIARLSELRLVAQEERIDAELALGNHGELTGELEALAAEHPLRERLREQLMLALYRSGRQAEALEVYQAARKKLVDDLGIEPSPELQELNRRILNQDASLAAPARRSQLPAGTVTMLFTDVEGSTVLLERLGREPFVEALAAHRRLLRETFAAHGGVEVEMQGDSFHFAFARAEEAVAAAAEAQRALAAHSWEGEPLRVRIGLHSGEPIITDNLYAGLDVHRAARVMSAAHGGQVVLTQATRELLGQELELRDLGLHRLKDLSEPERLFQLGNEEFPPLSSLNASNLPVPPTALIGRERELAELVELASHARLVTLTGPGGIGKTRLALQVAAELVVEYEQGVTWVPLAPLRDPGLVFPTIAQALGVKRELREELADKHLLLLLDNLEQLLDVAPALAELLASCPKLNLLLTSRECLHVSGEREYQLSPLVEEEAVALFRERAHATQLDFRANGELAAICRALDGLPLAIELAAARVKLLSPAKLLERLEQRLPLLTGGARDAPERQQTLSATIAWSYELLHEEDRRLFARLSVFAGGCTLEAAEEICEANLDSLQSLADKSLLRRRKERFVMLETIREYARERLGDIGEAEMLRRRHADYFLTLAEDAEQQAEAVEGVDERSYVVALAPEHDNLRRALSFLHREGEAALVLRLAIALGRFWDLRGYWDEGRSWLEYGLKHAAEPTTTRASGLLELSYLEWRRDPERGLAAAEEAVAIFRRLGDDEGLCRSLLATGASLGLLGRRTELQALFDESARLATRTGNRRLLSTALGNLGDNALTEGDFERGFDLEAQALALARAIGDQRGIATSTFNLGLAAFQLGRYPEALPSFRESLAACREIEWKEGVAWCLEETGATLAMLGELEQAALLIGFGEALREELACDLGKVEQAVRDTAVAELRRQLGERLASQFTEGRALTLEDAVEYALAESHIPASVAATRPMTNS